MDLEDWLRLTALPYMRTWDTIIDGCTGVIIMADVMLRHDLGAFGDEGKSQLYRDIKQMAPLSAICFRDCVGDWIVECYRVAD